MRETITMRKPLPKPKPKRDVFDKDILDAIEQDCEQHRKREYARRHAMWISRLAPIELDEYAMKLGLKRVLVFDEQDMTVLSFIGVRGTLNLPLNRKGVEMLAGALNRRLEELTA
jgi:hypothetical protein